MARPRTPTALKLVKGTAQPCRTNKREPKGAAGMPKPPEHLSPRAQRAWPGIARQLQNMGVLTKADGLVLEALCETYGELVEARQRLRARGALAYLTEPPDETAAGRAIVEALLDDTAEVPGAAWLGQPFRLSSGKIMWRAFPEVAMIADLDRRFAMWLAKVGLTPADRSRVSAVAGEEAKDPWGDI